MSGPELTDSINDPAAKDLRANSPELFNSAIEAPTTTTDDGNTGADDAGADDTTAGATEGAEDGPGDAGAATATGKAPRRDDRVPKSRLDEVIAERNAERDARRQESEERGALKARLDLLEQARAGTPPPTPAAASTERDIQAEIDALEDQYDSGDLEIEEYRKAHRTLNKELQSQLVDRAVSRATKKVEDDLAASALQGNQQKFESALAGFLADPTNKVFQDSAIHAAALNTAMEELAKETGYNITHADLFARGKEKVLIAFGQSPAPVPAGETEKQRVERERRNASIAQNGLAATIPGRPAGGLGARGTQTDIDPGRVSTAEWAKLPQAERDRQLGKNP